MEQSQDLGTPDVRQVVRVTSLQANRGGPLLELQLSVPHRRIQGMFQSIFVTASTSVSTQKVFKVDQSRGV